MVCDALVTACRRAGTPTTTSPAPVQATTDGVIRSPSGDASTCACPRSSSAATHELVVPRSMPMMRVIAWSLLLPHQAGQEALALVGGQPPHVGQLARGALVGRIDLEHRLEPLGGLHPVAL